MALVILRCFFVLVAAGVGFQLINSEQLPRDSALIPWAVFGGCVLLSPACASFDMFEDYEARGREFKRIVKDLEPKMD